MPGPRSGQVVGTKQIRANLLTFKPAKNVFSRTRKSEQSPQNVRVSHLEPRKVERPALQAKQNQTNAFQNLNHPPKFNE
ncbi:MAG TPA: hypothetical protein DCS30_10160 [Rhizobiales bacterium]|nr:hypothetical protein [Hyphomicrobiales bacterium]